MTATRQHPRFLMMDGQVVPYESAQVHVLSTAVKYAAIVYEGIRGYWNDQSGQLYLFRVGDHLRRLADSALVTRMSLPASPAALAGQIAELARLNELREDIHVRVLAYVAADDGGLDSVDPVGTVIATMPMGRYPERRQAGAGQCVRQPLAAQFRRRLAGPGQDDRELPEQPPGPAAGQGRRL